MSESSISSHFQATSKKPKDYTNLVPTVSFQSLFTDDKKIETKKISNMHPPLQRPLVMKNGQILNFNPSIADRSRYAEWLLNRIQKIKKTRKIKADVKALLEKYTIKSRGLPAVNNHNSKFDVKALFEKYTIKGNRPAAQEEAVDSYISKDKQKIWRLSDLLKYKTQQNDKGNRIM